MASGKAGLRAVAGDDAGALYVIRPGQRFVAGRGRDATVRVEGMSTSRRHAAVALLPEGLLVEDLGSRNGTHVRGRRLPAHTPTRARHGDTLQVGDGVFRVEIPDEPPEGERDEHATRGWVDAPDLIDEAEFEVLGELGRGSNGIVYAARQRLLEREVALKVPLPAALTGDDTLLARFVREARIQSGLTSPYVVAVYDIRRVGAHSFLIMELVNGYSVRDLLRGEREVSVAQAVRIARDVALGLESIHALGIVHRDVKPANVLLSPDGPAKLSDFGIARAAGEATEGAGLTPTGHGLGSLPYVSPEQAAHAKTADARTDVYGLGATLFHLLAGRPPVQARTPAELVRRLAEPIPSLRELRSDCPYEVEALVARMLRRDPDERRVTAGAAAAGLEQQLRRLDCGRRSFQETGEHEFELVDPGDI